MTLMFTPGHRISKKLELLCSHSGDKLSGATQTFMMFYYVNEQTVKMSCVANMDCLSICSSCSYMLLFSGSGEAVLSSKTF